MVILFAIIGMEIEAGFWYWVFFGLMCGIRLANAFSEALKD